MSSPPSFHSALAAASLVLAAWGSPQREDAGGFARARGVLERRCLECHGGAHRESELSFADRTTFERGGARGPVIDRDEPAASRLLAVVGYGNPDLAMPPSGVLPDAEREVLEAWVRAGAPWPEGPEGRLADPDAHPLDEEGVGDVAGWWAYEPLVAPEVPAVTDAEWSRSPVDALIRARMVGAGLEPAPHARPEALLRRASFDLTGLPPTPEERADFLATLEAHGFDRAWSELLDRLFSSPHYGEHQARRWLDLVRYAETNGYERDARKTNVWRYRDWVVRAFDEDLPYDRFAQMQLAGDELAAELETDEERAQALLATGYFRLGVWDDEPADRDQASADERADIVDTTSQVFLGTTMGCARCHDHKADPITQREYYELTAHFAGIVGYGGGDFGQHLGGGATRDVGDPPGNGVRTVEERDAELAELDAELAAAARALGFVAPDTDDDAGRVLVQDARGDAATWRYHEGTPPEGWATPAFDDAAWGEAPGAFGHEGTPGTTVATTWSSERIQIRTTFRLEEIPAALRLTLIHDDNADVFLNGQRILHAPDFRDTYGSWQLPRSALDALAVGRNVLAVDCRQTGGGQVVDAGLDTAYERAATGALRAGIEAELALRTADDAGAQQVRALLDTRDALAGAPTTEPYPAQVVFEAGSEPPAQFVHLRGSVHAPGDEVRPALPAAWTHGSSADAAPYTPADPAAHTDSSGRRRAFAEWLFEGGAHLAARVEANRIWQSLFGRGIARTPGDFGRLGEAPVHPELLDHIALRLIELGWSRKALQRSLMETRAYRAATVGPEASLAADPRGELFWRFEPRRLTAEEYRDAALAVSGELNRARFGPSVFPPLPQAVLATASRPGQAWSTSGPEASARRSLYVHVKRSLRVPLLAALDQPDPDLPCPARFPTNVPTQALLTLNGDFTGERASALAEHLVATSEEGRERLRLAIEQALSRAADAGELDRAETLVAELRSDHGLDDTRALELFLLGLFNRNEFLWLD